MMNVTPTIHLLNICRYLRGSCPGGLCFVARLDRFRFESNPITSILRAFVSSRFANVTCKMPLLIYSNSPPACHRLRQCERTRERAVRTLDAMVISPIGLFLKFAFARKVSAYYFQMIAQNRRDSCPAIRPENEIVLIFKDIDFRCPWLR